MAYCSNCGKKLESDAKFCSACGKPINTVINGGLNESAHCPSCGHLISALAVTCPACGFEIKQRESYLCGLDTKTKPHPLRLSKGVQGGA